MPRPAPTSVPKPFADGRGDLSPPVGAEVCDAGVSFRVWAPDHREVNVVIGRTAEVEPQRRFPLESEDGGFFSGTDPDGRPGELYWYEVDGMRLPDPASRFQPFGVEGPSQIIEPRSYPWITRGWRSPGLRGRIIYELHVGAFTPAGTFRGAVERLDALVDLGVNTIELMPLADFAGDRNWGYDGVMWFAPARCYGAPDDLRRLVDAAHERDLAVMVDVVYNHLGPVGNVFGRYAQAYFHPSRHSPWGQSLNYDGTDAEPVRQLVLQNVAMWFDEYHVDGLRLDALHAIEDGSPRHLAAEIAAAAHARGGFVVGEDERNEARLLAPRDTGGWGMDGVWADDFHHTIRVGLTREREGYFACYNGTPDEWLATFRGGWLFQGQHFEQWGRGRGSPAGHLPPERFVWCISNHDQVGNRPLGDRLNAVVSPQAYRAVSLLLCLAPYTPMLFMGQEWSASSPFPYFTDHPGDLGEKIRSGRLAEYRDNKAFYGEEVLSRMPDPQAVGTFAAAKLNWNERREMGHAEILALYRECLRLRAAEPVFQSAPRDEWRVELVEKTVLAVRWRHPERDWLLLFSLTAPDQQIVTGPVAQTRAGRHWELVLSSNEERFGGPGVREASGGEDGAPVLISPGAMLLREA